MNTTHERTHMTDTTQQTAPRVTAERIDALVASLTYHTMRMPNEAGTIVTAKLPGGFVVARGEAACLSPSTFDVETSEKLARNAAAAQVRSKLWELEAYHLKRVLEERRAGGEG
jgi:hypothetical protein